MADSELADLTEATSLAATDLLYAVVDPAGTPLDRKITAANLRAALGPGLSTFAAYPKTGRWNGPAINADADGSLIDLVNDQETAVPLIVAVAGTIDRIGFKVDTTVGSAGSVCRLGVRADNAGYPGATVVLDAGTVATESASDKTITVSQALPAGLYWLTITHQVATTPPKVSSVGNTSTSRINITGAIGIEYITNPYWGNAGPPVQTGVTGALPSSWTGTTKASYWPLIGVRWA